MNLLMFPIIVSLISMSPEQKQEGTSKADSSDYHYKIPDYPESYSPGNVAARVVDGLGFRFYWASEGLSQKDLEFRPSEEASSTAETINHILNLSTMIVDAVLSQPNIRQDWSALSVDEKRAITLANIRKASELLKADHKEMEDYQIIFERPQGNAVYPFWNILNGPLADALYHTGQVVSFRRSSGNPIDPNVNVLIGKKRE